jgi:hypothetical protein
MKTIAPRAIVLLSMLMFLFSCSSERGGVERIMEDGVEVVINHLEPYEVKGEPTTLVLEEELRIDFEDEKFAGLGISMPEGADADSKGNIYIYDRSRASDYFVLKFDKKGNFLKEFGRIGQGPGEIQGLMYLRVNAQDEVMITDYDSKKIIAYDTEGGLLYEKRYEPRWTSVIPLENGGYLATGRYYEETPDGIGLKLALYNSEFEEIRKIHFFDYSHKLPGKKQAFGFPFYYWRVKNGRIYVGDGLKRYEICVFDYDGNLLRKIRKEYSPVKYPENFRKLVEMTMEVRDDLYPREYTPPLNSFFIDDDDRLYAMTYEQEENQEEYIHDIYNADGVFIGRKSFGMTYMLGQGLNHLRVNARNNRYYRLRYKEELGYVELIVYKMRWE